MPPDLELLNRAVQAYQPNPRRVPFHELKPLHAAIVELRAKKASYAAIAELLQRSGVKTSRARVAEYGRLVLAGGKTRKRRKVRPHNAPPVPSPAPAVPLPPTSSVPIAGLGLNNYKLSCELPESVWRRQLCCHRRCKTHDPLAQIKAIGFHPASLLEGV